MTFLATDISIRFGGVLAVDGLSLSASPGEILGLIGPNGAGKTTFINCISGACRAQSGSATWEGEELVGRAPHEIIRRGVVRTFQNVSSLHDLTVLDIVKLGEAVGRSSRRLLDGLRSSDRDRESRLMESVLRPLNLIDVAHQPVQTLPYGLRKAVDLARALAAGPKLLLLDEPVAGLTSHESATMAEVIRSVRDRIGCAVMMVEHKMHVVNSTCDRIVVMASGAKIFEGSTKEAQRDPEVRRIYLGEAA
jgi:branched-chain amino acid transport system ATP-binding protein